MNCKFCNGELPENVTLCPQCGKENLEEVTEGIAEEIPAEIQEEGIAEEPAEEAVAEEAAEEAVTEAPVAAPKQKPKAWLIVLAVIGAVALVAVLVGAVLFGMGVLSDKGAAASSYTVGEEEAVKARDVVVARVGDEELTNSELQIYYWQSVDEFYSYYGYYMDMESMDLDLEKPMDQQYYNEEEGITWQQYFVDGALSSWSRYAALSMLGKEAGFELDADAKAYVESIPADLETLAVSYGYENAAAMLKEDMGAACDVEGYKRFLYTNIYAGQYLASLENTLVPTMDEIEAYYAENEETLVSQGLVKDGSTTVDVRHILICPTGGVEDDAGEVTYSEAEWEACRLKAQQLYDQWLADGTEAGFAELAMEYTEDTGSMETGGLYEDVYQGQMVEAFDAWCFDASRKYGDSGLVKTEFGYHIMFFVDSEEVWISNVTNTIISERSLELVNGAVAKWPLDADYKKIVIGETTTATAEE